jgi:hypothetical protein
MVVSVSAIAEVDVLDQLPADTPVGLERNCIRRNQVGPVGRVERWQRARDSDRAPAALLACVDGNPAGPLRELLETIDEPFACQQVGDDRVVVGRDDVGARADVVEMHLLDGLRVMQQRHRRPDRAAVVGHARTARLELGAHRTSRVT